MTRSFYRHAGITERGFLRESTCGLKLTGRESRHTEGAL
jgi:hypothetical protein